MALGHGAWARAVYSEMCAQGSRCVIKKPSQNWSSRVHVSLVLDPRGVRADDVFMSKDSERRRPKQWHCQEEFGRLRNECILVWFLGSFGDGRLEVRTGSAPGLRLLRDGLSWVCHLEVQGGPVISGESRARLGTSRSAGMRKRSTPRTPRS